MDVAKTKRMSLESLDTSTICLLLITFSLQDIIIYTEIYL